MLEALTEPQLVFEVNIWTVSSLDMCGLQEEYMRCSQSVSTHEETPRAEAEARIDIGFSCSVP